ncbi:MAG TPA: zinc-binding dehydrogenase [Acidimicrobiales bacterium]|nr:zinc-binding dehydrogenase [Acidimicrobiales bacterium]
MRALSVNDNSLVFVERATPKPGPHDVVVSIRAAGINAADLLQRQGYYPAPPGWPEDIPGLEMAGVISAVGDEVHEPLLGRRVCAIVGGGAQSTHCVVPAEHLIFVPDHVSWAEAGGFAEAFCTAHDALLTQAHLDRAQRVLISGASGGVGVAAVQIARATGAHVTAVTRTSEHHEDLRTLGADQTITIDQVGDIDPVDVVLELVGAAHLTRAMDVLAPMARVVIIGVGGGSRMEVDLRVIMRRRALLTGSTLRARSRAEKATVIDRVIESLVPLWTTGELRVPIARNFDFDDALEAYDFFARSGKFGKVVMLIDQ